MKQTKSVSQTKDFKKNAFGLTHNKTDLQQLDLMCSSLNFANGFYAAKLLNLLKFEIKETLPYLPKNRIIGGKSAKKSKFQKVGTLKSHQNKKQTNQNFVKNQQLLNQFDQNSRNKQISIQYYHSDLKQIQSQKQKFSPQKQKKSHFSNSNLSSINSLYHVFKNVQLKISQPADLDLLQQDKNKSKSSQIPNAGQFLKSISIKSKLNQKYQKNSSPIDMLKQQKNKFTGHLHKNFNEETQPNFFDISKVQLSSKKIQKPNHLSSQKHSEKQQQTFKSKNKFQKVQKKYTNKLVNNQSKFSSKDDKNLKTYQNLDQKLNNQIKLDNPDHKQIRNGHKRKSTDDSLQNLHIELQYIHKVKENQQKQKLKLKQKQKGNALHEKDSFNRVLQQEQIDEQYYQSEQYKVLRSTSQLSQKQIYELMSVQGNKYKQIALKNYFKKQKIHNNNQKNQKYKEHKYPQY